LWLKVDACAKWGLFADRVVIHRVPPGFRRLSGLRMTLWETSLDGGFAGPIDL
jgi:hypothetical protein